MKTIYLFLLFTFSLPSFSQTKIFLREYTYTAGEADSKITSRAIALDQVKRILLEEIGVYLYSEMQTNKEENNDIYNELTKQQIQTITAGITETKIIEEIWNGDKYYIKASIAVDPDEVNKNIARIGADQNKLKELVDVQNKADDAFAEIGRLRKELATTKSENGKLAKQKQYNSASNTLTASDWFQKAFNAYEVSLYDDAILYLQKAIALDLDEPVYYHNLAGVYVEKKNIAKAIYYYKKTIEIDAKYSSAYFHLGMAYINNGNIDNAITLYKKVVKNMPTDSTIKDLGKIINLKIKVSELEFQIGTSFQTAGNLDSAIYHFKKAVHLGKYEAYFNLGNAYTDKNDFDNAIFYFLKTIEIDPQDASTYINLAGVYFNKTDYDKAIQSYEKAIELNPQFSKFVYNSLGNSYHKKGNLDKAIQLYKKSIELNPQLTDAYYNLGTAYKDKGNSEEAILFFQKAAKLGDKDAQQLLKDHGYSW